ncbi:hypothetical protein CP532_3290 [Ophiocordyceps camponoti-leonardi (nom. inval.)]|nr:hypothetical protein CP532_3290 [Ophiocordyceps camponoti-leonardi (nom. inval.)]
MLKISRQMLKASRQMLKASRQNGDMIPSSDVNANSSSNKTQADQVVPVRFFDYHPLIRSLIVHTMLVFDDVLDPHKLHDGLRAVVERDDGWRRLGARLGRNKDNGRVEFRIPASFNAHRPAFKFSHVDHGTTKMAEHPTAARLPKPSSRVAVLAKSNEFEDLARGPNTPRTLQDYIDSQEPMLGLHVVSFSDATLVSLHWPHMFMDGMAGGDVLRAVSLALQGRHEEIPKTYAVDVDPLAELGRHPTERHKLWRQKLSFFGFVCLGLRNLCSIFLSSLERRVICIPAAFVASLRRDALAELEADKPATKNLFLTEGDVLSAWWTRLCLSTQAARNPGRTVVLRNAISLRTILSGKLLQRDRPYLGNAFQFIDVLIRADDMPKRPLTYLAYQIRRRIEEQGSRGQVEAFAALWRASLFGLKPVFGNSGMLTIVCSNWTKIGFFYVDFSAAIPTSEHHHHHHHRLHPRPPSRLGKPSFVYHNRLNMEALVGPNTLIIMGKDGDGNYWLDASARRKYWGRIEEELAKATI